MSTPLLDTKSYYNVRVYGRKRPLHEALALHAKKSKLDNILEYVDTMVRYCLPCVVLPYILIHLYFRDDKFTWTMAYPIGATAVICAVVYLVVGFRCRQQFYAYERIRVVLTRYLKDYYDVTLAEGVWDRILRGDRDSLFCAHQGGYAHATLDCSSDRVVLRDEDELPRANQG